MPAGADDTQVGVLTAMFTARSLLTAESSICLTAMPEQVREDMLCIHCLALSLLAPGTASVILPPELTMNRRMYLWNSKEAARVAPEGRASHSAPGSDKEGPPEPSTVALRPCTVAARWQCPPRGAVDRRHTS